MSNIDILFKPKYLKYKTKYLMLKDQSGSGSGKSTLLMFNKESCPAIMNAIETYKQNLNAIVKLLDTSTTKGQKPIKLKTEDLVVIGGADLNGNTTIFKHVLGSNSIDPMFHIFFLTIDPKQQENNDKTPPQLKKLKDSITNNVKIYNTCSKLDFGQNENNFKQISNNITCNLINNVGNSAIGKINKYITVNTPIMQKRLKALDDIRKLQENLLAGNFLTITDKTEGNIYPKYLEYYKKELDAFIVVKKLDFRNNKMTFVIESISDSLLYESLPKINQQMDQQINQRQITTTETDAPEEENQ